MKLKSIAQSLLRQNYYVTHSYHLCRLWWEGLKTPDKIIVYQMGKVGSTTIWKSLEALNLGIPIYHVHGITHHSVQKQVTKSKERFQKLRAIYIEIAQAEYLRNQLDSQTITKPWNVITLVRDPIAQTLSSFFQALEMERKLGFTFRETLSPETHDQAVHEIVQRFHRDYVNNAEREHPYAWFDREMKVSLGINVFIDTTSEVSDYYICSGEKASVLLLKLESLNNSYKKAFRDFLGIQDFHLVTSNLGSQKSRYGSFYKDFIDRVRLPDHYLDSVYYSPLVRTFYSDAEIEDFYQRWRHA